MLLIQFKKECGKLLKRSLVGVRAHKKAPHWSGFERFRKNQFVEHKKQEMFITALVKYFQRQGSDPAQGYCLV